MSSESPSVAGSVKRKSVRRTSNVSYKDASSAGSDEEDSKPLIKRRKTTATIGSDSDVPLSAARSRSSNGVKKTTTKAAAKTNGTNGSVKPEPKDESDSDVPLSKRTSASRRPSQRSAKNEASSECDSDVPLSKRKQPKSKPAASASKTSAATKRAASKPTTPTSTSSSGVKKESSKTAAAKPAKKEPVKKEAGKKETESKTKAKPARTPAKKAKVEESSESPKDDSEELDDDEYRWWEMPSNDGTIKWTTLEHNGVLFPPAYEPLPSNVHMLYNGKPVTMSVEAEEVAGFFGMMLNSTNNVDNPVFRANFFQDFKEILDSSGGAKFKDSGKPAAIIEFEKCDFTVIFQHYDDDRMRKRALSSAEKKEIKAARDEMEAPFTYCLWDGRKQKVGNFRIEPPSLFRGRGDHPKTGRVKKRVQPKQVTINIGKGATVPDPPEGHRWKEVKNDQEGTWLAMWQENVNGNYKYVMLSADSAVKGQSDYKKFEKARELKKHISRIRTDYTRDLKSNVMADRQRATAVYLIDKFALRAGNEKGEEEADTVGCCSLKYEHITLEPPKTVIFDFLGKDSIRFYHKVEVDVQVFKNLKIFKKSPKGPGDEIFDRLTTSALNKHLGKYMAGLTAKVFRTYNASWTMASLLKEMKSVGTVAEKMKDYNEANRTVALLCNHKRSVAATHDVMMGRMQDKIDGMRYQQWRTKQMMLDLDPNLKRKKGYFTLPADLKSAWVQTYIDSLVDEQQAKIAKKFEKDNLKLVQDGEAEMAESELATRLEAAVELRAKLELEKRTKKVIVEGKGMTIERLEQNLEKLQDRITAATVQRQDRDDNKEVALSTSKVNYIDPRLSVVFCKKFDVPIERVFPKALRDKFAWAIQSVDESWAF